MTGKKMSFRVRMILLVFVFMLTVNVALVASIRKGCGDRIYSSSDAQERRFERDGP